VLRGVAVRLIFNEDSGRVWMPPAHIFVPAFATSNEYHNRLISAVLFYLIGNKSSVRQRNVIQVGVGNLFNPRREATEAPGAGIRIFFLMKYVVES
jgi:hypothetical protein